jgi:hypothetical protein
VSVDVCRKISANIEEVIVRQKASTKTILGIGRGFIPPVRSTQSNAVPGTHYGLRAGGLFANPEVVDEWFYFSESAAEKYAPCGTVKMTLDIAGSVVRTVATGSCRDRILTTAQGDFLTIDGRDIYPRTQVLTETFVIRLRSRPERAILVERTERPDLWRVPGSCFPNPFPMLVFASGRIATPHKLTLRTHTKACAIENELMKELDDASSLTFGPPVDRVGNETLIASVL